MLTFLLLWGGGKMFCLLSLLSRHRLFQLFPSGSEGSDISEVRVHHTLLCTFLAVWRCQRLWRLLRWKKLPWYFNYIWQLNLLGLSFFLFFVRVERTIWIMPQGTGKNNECFHPLNCGLGGNSPWKTQQSKCNLFFLSSCWINSLMFPFQTNLFSAVLPGSGKTKCPTPFFACPSGRCIPMSWTCDKENDCENGADEAHCGKFVYAVQDNRPLLCFNVFALHFTRSHFSFRQVLLSHPVWVWEPPLHS